jgi:hypothetical protein
MSNSPNGQRRPIDTPRTYVVDLFAKLTGGGAAADMVNADSAVNGGGEIVTAVRAAQGSYTITFRKLWPQLLDAPKFSFIDATAANVAGLDGTVTAIDVTAGTATFFFSQNSTTGVDIPTTTTVYVRWTVRASSKN